MIISADGHSTSSAECSAGMSATVSMVGEAYGKKSTVRSIIRFFRKMKNRFVALKKRFVSFVVVYFGITKTGKPSSTEPPSVHMI